MGSRRIIVICLLLLAAGGSSGGETPDAKRDGMSLEEARDLLSAHAVRDAVVLAPSGTWRSSPALADIDGDGDLEIVAAVGGRWVGVWHHDGRPMEGWPILTGHMDCSPAVGDVDGDGNLEIALPGCLYGADGSPLPGWPLEGHANSFCTPCLDDVDGDGDLEVLSTDFESGVSIHHHDGTVLPGWPVSLPKNDIRSTPQAYDIDNDGEKEIIFLYGPEEEIRIHRLDGSLRSKIPFPGIWAVTDSFVLADTDANGSVELVYNGRSVDLGTGQVTEMGWGGGRSPCLIRDETTGDYTLGCPLAPRGSYPAGLNVSDQGGSYADSAVAGDIDGDGQVEILFGNREGGFHAYRLSGGQAAGWPKRLSPSGDCGMAIGDLDGDGDLEVVANTEGERIYVFDSPGPATGSVPWPLYLANNRRTGTPDPDGPPRAKPAKVAGGEIARGLSAALASGNWTSAADVYRQALAVLEDSSNEGDAALRQQGLLSIARILNTRARRFEEAAEYYRRAVEASPGTWLACQSLGECATMVPLYPDLTGVRESLAAIVDVCLSHIDAVKIPEADLFRCELLNACLLLERNDELEQLARPLTQNPQRSEKTYTGVIAERVTRYGGFPFDLRVRVDTWTRYRTSEKDLVTGGTVSVERDYMLNVCPQSPSLEVFPFTLKLSADPDMDFLESEGWTKEPDGRWTKTTKDEVQSTGYGRIGVHRIALFRLPESFEPPTIRREIERMDGDRFKEIVMMKTVLPEPWFSLSLRGRDETFAQDGITPPHGVYLTHPTEIRVSSSGKCRCGCGKPIADYYDVARGATFETVINLLPGSKPFHPELLFVGRKRTMETLLEEPESDRAIRGSLEGIDFEISSPRRFKIDSREVQVTRDWLVTLEGREADVK